MLQSLGIDALIGMFSHILFIILTWRALQGLRLENLIRKGSVVEARIIYLFISIAIGSSVSEFFLDFLKWSQQLTYLFS
ncbi:MAG: DUF1146 domain-containing protein [Bacillaceae bacterium]|nr:DUF1146 domain-containing protein [Bacillaceae bacterium]